MVIIITLQGKPWRGVVCKNVSNTFLEGEFSKNSNGPPPDVDTHTCVEILFVLSSMRGRYESGEAVNKSRNKIL